MKKFEGLLNEEVTVLHRMLKLLGKLRIVRASTEITRSAEDIYPYKPFSCYTVVDITYDENQEAMDAEEMLEAIFGAKYPEI